MTDQARVLPRIVSSADAPSMPTIRLQAARASAPARAEPPRSDTRPCFTSSWIAEPDSRKTGGIRYSVSGVGVEISSDDGKAVGMYAIDPPEYRLNPLQLRALAEVMEEIVDDLPEGMDLSSLDTIRPHIKSRAKDMLYAKLAGKSEGGGDARELERSADFLSDVLCKYTAGYGVLETLLEDGNVQDVYVDAPSGQNPVHVVLRSELAEGVRQKCRTNLFVGRRDLAGIVSRMKLETGLPFSEASPVLEADIARLGARVTIVGPPLSEKGIAIAVRKRSEAILPLDHLIANSTLSPLLASFLWACVVGRRTLLISGSRGAGKTTLLSSLLLEFPRSQRMILIEDTPEIPVRRLQELGYDLQALRFRSSKGSALSSAEESLRVSLRMGESAIVLGEVRGTEAKVLYESMRAGSAGSAVLGTIHGNSAKGVLDRAVEDLGVSERAFSATDIVVVMGLMRSPDGSRFHRRVVEVSEVRECASGIELVPLFELSPGGSCAKPTDHFSAASKTVRGIASAFGIPPDTMLGIVRSRAYAEQTLVESLGGRTSATDGSRERLRVRWNEFLTSELFGENGCAASACRSWLDEHAGE